MIFPSKNKNCEIFWVVKIQKFLVKKIDYTFNLNGKKTFLFKIFKKHDKKIWKNFLVIFTIFG